MMLARKSQGKLFYSLFKKMESSSGSSNGHYQQQHHNNQYYYYQQQQQQQHHNQQQLQQQEQMKLYQQQQEYLHQQQQQQQQLYQPYQQQQQAQLLAQGQTFVKGNIMVDQHGVYVEGSDHKFLINVKDLDIDMENIIGRGACSVVRVATHRSSGIKIALKMISIFDQSKREQIFEEIQSLYSTNCPAIISFYGAFFSDDILAIALEYMDGGSLQTVLEDVGVIPESVLANITFQILWGLAYLKHERRVHRDIKPSNILINSSGQIKLTDFGVSKELMSSIAMGQTFVGTFKYMSPERVENKPHSYSSDIWSLGIVLIECATKKCPFDDVDSSVFFEIVQSILNNPSPTLPNNKVFTPEMHMFISLLLKKDPVERPTPEKLLGHKWLSQHGAHSLEDAANNVAKWIQSLQ